MARVRKETYIDFAWPYTMGQLYQSNGIAVALGTSIAIMGFLLLALTLNGSFFGGVLGGNFYAVFPHNTLVLIFGSVFTFIS